MKTILMILIIACSISACYAQVCTEYCHANTSGDGGTTCITYCDD